MKSSTAIRISVALATYNGANYLEELLNSLLKQSLEPFEIVIVDDCSSDGTLAILESYQQRYKQIKIHVNNHNLGPISSFKKAVAECIGDYFALCDQDDIWLQNKLEMSVHALSGRNPPNKPSLVYSDLKLIDENGKIVSESFWKSQRMNPKSETFYTMFFGNVVTGCTVVFNKAMKAEMLAMPDAVLMHDHWLALVAYGIGNVNVISSPTILYRDHQTSVTKKSRISFPKRLLNTLMKAFGHNDYLNRERGQILLFKEMYYQKLTTDRKYQVDTFLRLSGSNLFCRKYYSLMRYQHSKHQ
jgi:glycosyltransferase involved in cell wall biosynthesis